MNIPSLETILTDLDEARRQRNASNRKIEELTDALDNAGMIIERLTQERDSYKKAWNSAEDQITELKETRNRLSGEVDEIHAARSFLRDQNRLMAENHALKSALREAKEALSECVDYWIPTSGNTPHEDAMLSRYSQTITTINKVLGEE